MTATPTPSSTRSSPSLTRSTARRATATVNVSTFFSGGFPGLSGMAPSGIGGILGGGALLPALPGALAGGTAAAGTLGLAIAGVSKALRDYSKQQQSAATATGQSAASQVSAANTIRSAQQAVAQAKPRRARPDHQRRAIKNAQLASSRPKPSRHDAITSAEHQERAAGRGHGDPAGGAGADQRRGTAQGRPVQRAAGAAVPDAGPPAGDPDLQQLTNASADAALNVQQDRLNLQQAAAEPGERWTRTPSPRRCSARRPPCR